MSKCWAVHNQKQRGECKGDEKKIGHIPERRDCPIFGCETHKVLPEEVKKELPPVHE